ncbi:YdaS family helix-turn-helix protein [Castellaniella sp. WN]
MSTNPSVSQAVERLGGLAKTAETLGLNRYQTVQSWVATGRVPARYCAALEAASGVSRFKLRPDDAALIWPELAKEPANV